MSILPDAETFRRLVDGSLRGVGPAVLRGGLAAIAAPYATAVAARNLLYDLRLLPCWAADLPVVSVGNLTLGGTGKTPLVAWVARHFAGQGLKPAVVSRGYAASRSGISDEAAELAIVLPGVPHVADRDRAAAARRAGELGADVVILDDGFQHRRLRRNLDIVAVDATDPFGCDRIFPRGFLREPLTALRRADAVILSRADRVDSDRRAAIHSSVLRSRRGRPLAAWLETTHAPTAVRGADGSVAPLESLAGRSVAAFCGIGNPEAFRHTLAGIGADVVGFRSFADHHHYSAEDLDSLTAWGAATRAERLVTTLKDLVRIERTELGELPLSALEITLEPLADPAGLLALLAAAIRPGGRPA